MILDKDRITFYRLEWFDHYRLQRSWGKVMFLHLSVILFTGGCLPKCMLGYTPLPPGRHPPGQTSPLPSACWDTHTPAQCMLGYTPPAQCILGYTSPCPVHAGIDTLSTRRNETLPIWKSKNKKNAIYYLPSYLIKNRVDVAILCLKTSSMSIVWPEEV